MRNQSFFLGEIVDRVRISIVLSNINGCVRNTCSRGVDVFFSSCFLFLKGLPDIPGLSTGVP